MDKNETSARVIADSISTTGARITTLVIVTPRIILAEFNTHRALSRSSASSRAIPAKRMQEMVATDSFRPIRWMKDHKGMQGNDYFSPEETIGESFGHLDRSYNYESVRKQNTVAHLDEVWDTARDNALKSAEHLTFLGVSKQFTNRLLEPFMWHTIICTATEWDNFMALRNDSAAEIHIAKTAEKILEALNGSTPELKQIGEYHIPFGDRINTEAIEKIFKLSSPGVRGEDNPMVQEIKIKIAVARCARVSYLNYEGKDDYVADVKLYDSLVAMGHMSPLEHCAFASIIPTKQSGNFIGWNQLRKSITNENRTDDRIEKK